MARAELPIISDSQLPNNAPLDVAGFQAHLKSALAGEVRFDRLSRALYSTDASVYQIVPLGVVIPKSEQDVVTIVQACARFGLPITARGGGTSQAGQAIGPGVVLDFSKYLDQILEINATERWARVQPGCVLDDLNLAVRPHGLQFAPDVSTSNRATIGGMIANNSSGAHSIVYGKIVDHVLELRVALSDGGVITAAPLAADRLQAKCDLQSLEGACYRAVRRLAQDHAAEIALRFPKILRRVGGYNLDLFVQPGLETFNLAQILVGSEGTLGVIVEAKLRLVQLPKYKALTVIHFADLLDALAAAPLVLKHAPSAVEVVDRYVLDSTKMNPEASRLRDFLKGDPGAILIVEVHGEDPARLTSRLDALEQELRDRALGYHVHRAEDGTAQSRIWKLRKMALGLSMAQKGDAKAISFVEDTAVAPEHLRDYIAEFLTIVARHQTSAGVYAHASVGCLHVRPVINLKTEAGVRQFESIAGEVADLVLRYGGSLSGEHGDGLVRSPFQEKMFGPVLYNAFRELKQAFDPQNLLNPGKIVNAPPLTDNLRYGPAYNTPSVATTFDFSADGGIVQAAELCSGVGACRKKREGTMCPSYQATHDEQHTTRGRANTLRLAMTGQLGTEGLTDAAVKEALDLCLECKACKSECPTNVDMARLKAEFLDQYYRRHGLPWRNWIFGNVATLAWWGRRLPRLTRLLTASRLGRWINERLFAIDAHRIPPQTSRSTFDDYFFARMETWWVNRNRQPAVLVFPDTFVEYYEPHVGIAAVEFLQALGFTCEQGCRHGYVGPASLLRRVRCCGRPQISNGMLASAVRLARHNVEVLYPWAAEGKPIMACEPSCILTIRDDYPALLRGAERRKAEVVAAACSTFEELADAALVELESRGQPFDLKRGLQRILVHGHCHQRSLVGMEPTLRLLRRIPGADVIDVDAGCCGMAGSFGYEKEHYEISRQVGEQRLFPMLRKADAGTAVVASGFSCRQQIQHFTQSTALHPAELLQSLLRTETIEQAKEHA
ncbi:MAG TPA: FAD-linked oxidase C-terminal domain-containing protein [Gemmataceae bacterium]|nr:FAD-linked oxidase C-terminal domain-containing protein [Gemmataceae bacterium]